MSRRLSPESEHELADLTVFVEVLLAEMIEHHGLPPNALELYRESSESVQRSGGRSALLKGTRMAVNDMLQASKDLSSEEVKELDERLAARGAPTVTELRRRIWKLVPKILKRGSIRSEVEYYLLVDELNDVSGDLSDDERAIAGRLVAGFEDGGRDG